MVIYGQWRIAIAYTAFMDVIVDRNDSYLGIILTNDLVDRNDS